MRRSLLAALIVGAAALVPVQGGAAEPTIRSIDVVNNAFQPAAQVVAVGENVLWTFKTGTAVDPTRQETGTHTVTAYSGATFDSGVQSPGSTFSFDNYPGGEVLYRCQIHSTLDTSGKCTGMCGRLTDNPHVTLTAPSVVSPASGSISNTNEVVISFNVPGDMTALRVNDGGKWIATIGLCADGTCSSSASHLFPLTNGSHKITAFSVHQQGFYTASSAPVTVLVNGKDVKPPVVKLDQPRAQFPGLPPVVTNPVPLTGAATDDYKVKSIDVVITDNVAKTSFNANIACNGCDTPAGADSLAHASFAGTMVLAPGVYTIVVTARDTLDGGGRCQSGPANSGHCAVVSRQIVVAL
jgi:plastocyanin